LKTLTAISWAYAILKNKEKAALLYGSFYSYQ